MPQRRNGGCVMLPAAFDFRICTDSTKAARASFAALSQALAAAPISDGLAARLRALAPGARAAAGLMLISQEAVRHGNVLITMARLAPGDLYLDFVATLTVERPDWRMRFECGWPILFQCPPAVCSAGGEAAP